MWFTRTEQRLKSPSLAVRQQPSTPGFIERFPRLLQTSRTGLVPARLNKRYTLLIDNNRDLLTGKRILDLASHDGRWSLAALDVGAAHVTGIESRAHLVEHAQANCLAYGIDSGRYRFLHGDVFDALRAGSGQEGRYGVLFRVVLPRRSPRRADRPDRSAGPESRHARYRHLSRRGFARWSGFARRWTKNPTPRRMSIRGEGCAPRRRHPTRKAVDLLWGHFGYAVSEIDWQKPQRGEGRGGNGRLPLRPAGLLPRGPFDVIGAGRPRGPRIGLAWPRCARPCTSTALVFIRPPGSPPRHAFREGAPAPR